MRGSFRRYRFKNVTIYKYIIQLLLNFIFAYFLSFRYTNIYEYLTTLITGIYYFNSLSIIRKKQHDDCIEVIYDYINTTTK